MPPVELPTIVAACSAISSVNSQLRVAHRRARGDDRELREAVEQAFALGIEMLGSD